MYTSNIYKKVSKYDPQHKIRHCIILGIGVALTSACDSGGSDVGEGLQSVIASAPHMANQLDVSNLITTRSVASADTKNLLLNGSFEEGTSHWQTCNSNSALTIKNDASNGSKALQVRDGNCAQQGVAIQPDTEYALQCDAKLKSNRNDWTGLGISFYDEFWNFISEPDAMVITGRDYSEYAVSGTAPENARHAAIWFYSENKALLDNCTLSAADAPPPPASGNLLFNSEFIEGSDTATGWRDACNGEYQRNVGRFNESIYVASGACVHHRPSAEVLASIQGNYFAYSCEYTYSGNGYASIATNMTTLRDETGQNDVAILPQTYFGGVPAWQFDTVTLYGKAKDYLEPGDTFVSIGSQDSSGLTVLNCSLEIVSGQRYSIGDTGPSGGVVFSVTDDGMHGLEAAPTDVVNSGGRWCNDSILNEDPGRADIVGMDNISDPDIADSRSGRYNTSRINYACTEGVARLAVDHVWPNGETGGYLPNKDELELLYSQRNVVGNFAISDWYASSTEYSDSQLWVHPFLTNVANSLEPMSKVALSRVRSIQAF